MFRIYKLIIFSIILQQLFYEGYSVETGLPKSTSSGNKNKSVKPNLSDTEEDQVGQVAKGIKKLHIPPSEDECGSSSATQKVEKDGNKKNQSSKSKSRGSSPRSERKSSPQSELKKKEGLFGSTTGLSTEANFGISKPAFGSFSNPAQNKLGSETASSPFGTNPVSNSPFGRNPADSPFKLSAATSTFSTSNLPFGAASQSSPFGAYNTPHAFGQPPSWTHPSTSSTISPEKDALDGKKKKELSNPFKSKSSTGSDSKKHRSSSKSDKAKGGIFGSASITDSPFGTHDHSAPFSQQHLPYGSMSFYETGSRNGTLGTGTNTASTSMLGQNPAASPFGQIPTTSNAPTYSSVKSSCNQTSPLTPFGSSNEPFGFSTPYGSSQPFGSSTPFGSSSKPTGSSTPFGSYNKPFGSGEQPFGGSHSSTKEKSAKTPSVDSHSSSDDDSSLYLKDNNPDDIVACEPPFEAYSITRSTLHECTGLCFRHKGFFLPNGKLVCFDTQEKARSIGEGSKCECGQKIKPEIPFQTTIVKRCEPRRFFEDIANNEVCDSVCRKQQLLLYRKPSDKNHIVDIINCGTYLNDKSQPQIKPKHLSGLTHKVPLEPNKPFGTYNYKWACTCGILKRDSDKSKIQLTYVEPQEGKKKSDTKESKRSNRYGL